jgi:chromosome segregation ATPase
MVNGEDTRPAGFTVARHGYDRVEVNRAFQQAEARAQHLAAERDYLQQQLTEHAAALDAARREIAALNAKYDKLAAETGAQTREERMARALEVAKSQAGEITERAKVAAEHAWAGAEAASNALRDRFQTMLAELDQHHKTIMDTARTQAEELTTAAEKRRKKIDTDAERDRVRIDREFSESMNAKREALRKEVEAARAKSATEAARKLRDASDEAERRITAASAEVNRLGGVRSELEQQLRGTNQLLDRASGILTPAEQEKEETFEDTLLLPPPLPYDKPPSPTKR